MIFDQLSRSLQNNLNDYSSLNERIATGKKINKPSDDVVGLTQAMGYRLSISANDQFKRNISEANSQLNFANTVLDTVSSAIQQAKNAAIKGASGPLDPTTTTSLTAVTAQLRDQMLNLGNSEFRGRHIFAGFLTNQNAYNAATYAYQGDAGVMNVQIDSNAALPVNVPGSTALSYTLAAPDVVQISGGRFVHYTPGAGTTVNVEIRDTNDTTVLDTFSFSNVIQMTDTLSAAINTGNSLRSEALLKPFDNVLQQVTNVQADAGAWMSHLNDQNAILKNSTVSLQNTLSTIEDDNTVETATMLKKVQTSITALQETAAKVLSQSLLDFLR
jgi:flagellar hook-associated protein 3 FlgL